MTRLLLNTGSTPLHTLTGEPVPAGGIVTNDEMGPEYDGLEDEGVLVHVKPSELPEDEKQRVLSQAAREHLAGNAGAASSDDADVNTRSTRRGGQS